MATFEIDASSLRILKQAIHRMRQAGRGSIKVYETETRTIEQLILAWEALLRGS